MIIRGAFVSELEAYLWANAAERVGGQIVSITFAANQTTLSFPNYAGWRVFARVDNVTVTKARVEEEFDQIVNDITYRKAFESH